MRASCWSGGAACTIVLIALALASAFLAAVPAALALEPPRPGQLEQYRRDGTLDRRVAQALRRGSLKVDPGLAGRALSDLQRSVLGLTAPVLAPPPGSRGMPTTGTVKTFALLISFSDYAPRVSSNAYESMLFGDGDPANEPYESLSDYYSRSSYGRLDIQGDVLGWYDTGEPRSAVEMSSRGQQEVIEQALAYYDARGHDFSQYDNDGDGTIDYFLVFWTGPPGPWASFWWGYQSCWSDNGHVIDGKKLGTYSWQWEADEPLVAIHETGHALGIPDYYDYDGSVGPGGGVGGLDMMDGNRVDHNAFSKWLLGWVTPQVCANGSLRAKLAPSALVPGAMAVMPGVSSGDPFREFFLVQDRARTGNDVDVPNDGLLVWHVDARLNDSGGFAWNNSYTPHKLLRLMEADGLEQIESGWWVDDGDFYVPGRSFGPATTPDSRRYDGTGTGVTVGDIEQTGQDFAFTATSSAAPHIGSIQGTVTDRSARALANIWVTALRADGAGGWTWAGSAWTDAAGRYRLEGLEAGPYRVRFSCWSASVRPDDYLEQYYDGAGSVGTAADVWVVAGSTTGGIDADLVRTSHITGRVTDEAGVGIRGVLVICWEGADGSHTTFSAADGTYDVGGLQAGTYRIQFEATDGNYLTEYFDDVRYLYRARNIGVGVEATTSGIDAVLAPAAHISGTITSPGDSAGAVYVRAYRQTGGGFTEAGYASPGTDGRYIMGGLTAGTYRVGFFDQSGRYPAQYYDGRPDLASATDVVLEAAATRDGIDAWFEGSRIAGHVRGTSGAAIEGIRVTAFQAADAGWEEACRTRTGADGSYVLDRLDGGAYRIGFSDDGDSYVPQYYDGCRDLEPARDVTVAVQSTTTGIDAVLERTGAITGVVSKAMEAGPLAATVIAYRFEGADGWMQAAAVYPQSEGDYEVRGLRPGVYRIQFLDEAGTYAPQCFDGKPDLETATDVTVTGGATTTGVDAAFVPFGRIQGTVRDASGLAVGSACVSAWRPTGSSGWQWAGDGWSDAFGGYEVGGLRPGTYRVEIQAEWEGYAAQFFDRQPFAAWADAVPVAAGTTTTGIDAVLVAATDVSPPVTADDAPATWRTGPTAVHLRATDDTSGVVRIEYSRDDGGTWESGDVVTYRVWKRGGGSGVHTLLYRSTDLAGNTETPKTCVVMIDARAPVTRDDAPSGPQSAETTVHLAANDRDSGVQQTWHSLDGGPWLPGGSVVVPAAGHVGTHWICYYSVDVAGNVEGKHWCAVEIAGG